MRTQHFRQSAKRRLTAALLIVGVTAVLPVRPQAEKAPKVTKAPRQSISKG